MTLNQLDIIFSNLYKNIWSYQRAFCDYSLFFFIIFESYFKKKERFLYLIPLLSIKFLEFENKFFRVLKFCYYSQAKKMKLRIVTKNMQSIQRQFPKRFYGLLSSHRPSACLRVKFITLNFHFRSMNDDQTKSQSIISRPLNYLN